MSTTTAPLPPAADGAAAAASHRVLVNHEEQYCLWPAEKAIPAGWDEVFSGPRQACLEHIETVWTDMRPKSVRD